MCSKVGEMREGGSDFGKVADGDRAFDAQAVRLKKNSFSLQPSKKISVRAAMLDVAQAAVAENMTSNTYLCLVLAFDVDRCDFEKLFEFRFSCR